jgi:hypothetical protein
MNPVDHLDAALARLVLPDDLAPLPPATLRRLRDHAYVLMKACEQVLAQRVGQAEVKAAPTPEVERTIDAAREAAEPAGVLERLKSGERAP